MRKQILSNVHYNFDGYNQLVNFYETYKEEFFEVIELEINTWFDANLSALLGGVIDKLTYANSIEFGVLSQEIKVVLQKNSFLTHFGFDKLTDTNNTTIKYLKLKPTDSRFFNNYVQTELFSRNELPIMSVALKKKISESIFEMFVNAQIHSSTEFIYTCGQFFPQRHEIVFTIVDTGIGFAKRIEKNLGSTISSAKAIKWAMKEGHTTKRGTPGGIGLALLKGFIAINKGKIQIISGDAMYEFENGNESFQKLDGYFDGAVINMIFNTNDTTSYFLADEINKDDLF